MSRFKRDAVQLAHDALNVAGSVVFAKLTEAENFILPRSEFSEEGLANAFSAGVARSAAINFQEMVLLSETGKKLFSTLKEENP